jgi:hypothetical protein
MMSTIKTGNTTHDAKVNGAEAVRQAAVVPGATKATVVAADATFHRTAALSAVANGCGVVPFLTALRELGQTLYT